MLSLRTRIDTLSRILTVPGAMSDEFDAVVERVHERVSPDAEERERLQRAAETVRERALEAIAELPVEPT